MTKTLIGYARISTGEQSADLQVDALNQAGCLKIFTDQASGAKASRPELDKMLEQLRPGDVVVVWRLDRLGRSLKHLIDLVEKLGKNGVGFHSITENIGTTTPNERFMFRLFASLAEFEKDLIRERTMAGLAAARARGRVGGRPSVMNPKKIATARKLYDSREHTVAEIAEMLNVSVATVYRHLQDRTAA